MYSVEKLTQNLNISVFDSLLFSRSKIDARTFNNDVANGSCMEGGEDSKALRCWQPLSLKAMVMQCFGMPNSEV